ncbi:MAG: extracellular solute-binding protein [Propionicimonas sp.]
MKKRVSSIAAVLAAVLITVGCSSSPGQSNPAGQPGGDGKLQGKISFLEKWPDPRYKVYFDQVVADYIAANPGVEIDHQASGDQPIKDTLRVLTSANELPDIYFAWPGDFAKKFIRGGFAADLSEQLDGTDWGKTFAPSALGAYQYEGKYYGVPINLNAKVFAYSKAAFEKANVSVPTTLDELKTSCQALRDAGYTPIALGNQYGWPAIHYITQFNAQFVPADVRTADYNPAGGEFTNPGYEQALATFKDLVDTCSKPGANGISHETAQAELANGQAAMQYIEVLEFVNLEDEATVPEAFRGNWDQFPMPSIAGAGGDQTAITGAPDGFLVNAQSQHLDIAIDFLKFLTSKANAAELTKVIGWPSPIEGATSTENATEMTVKAVGLIQNAGELAIWLDTETHAEVAQAYLAGVEGLLNGDETPATVMQKVRDVAAKVRAES